jgi:CubicO group peptidase (beta-lactamase class C family)
MQLIEEDRLALDDRIARWIPEWEAIDRQEVTIRDLLSHSSGLPAHLSLYEEHRGRLEFRRAIAGSALEYEPRSRSVYSDLGFMLLGFVLEDAGGADLGAQFRAMVPQPPLAFDPPREWRRFTAPTSIERWRGRLLVGEVHDQNCWALGGTAGHAGLFGSAPAVAAFARLVLRALRSAAQEPEASLLVSPQLVRLFAERVDVSASTRALAWDTMKTTASCGTRMSAAAIGHTGFTGTSLWIDPLQDFYAVLLTNRVHPDGSNEQILTVRPAFHDAVLDGWDEWQPPGSPRTSEPGRS